MTRQPHIFFIILTAAFAPLAADACSRMQPVAAFIMLNDPEEFALYDIDHNGVVEARELGFNSVHYRTDPCLRIQSSNFMNLNASSVALH